MFQASDAQHSGVASAGPKADDAHLLQRVGQGDGAALDQLYGVYGGMAFGLALRITRDSALAEDVVQEAFLGVWRNAATYCDSRASAKTWLLSIVHHRAVDLVRRRQSWSDVESRVSANLDFVAPDVWPDVRQRLEAGEIAAALAALPAAQRIAIEMAYFGGLTQVEIAAATGTPVGTVKSRVRLGLLSLRRCLDSEERPRPHPRAGTPASPGQRVGAPATPPVS